MVPFQDEVVFYNEQYMTIFWSWVDKSLICKDLEAGGDTQGNYVLDIDTMMIKKTQHLNQAV